MLYTLSSDPSIDLDINWEVTVNTLVVTAVLIQARVNGTTKTLVKTSEPSGRVTLTADNLKNTTVVLAKVTLDRKPDDDETVEFELCFEQDEVGVSVQKDGVEMDCTKDKLVKKVSQVEVQIQ